jgi:hypothetical protein
VELGRKLAFQVSVKESLEDLVVLAREEDFSIFANEGNL